MPQTVVISYPIDPWDFLMFPVFFFETDLKYRKGRGSCSLLVAYGETQLCLKALLVLALEIIGMKAMNIILQSGNYPSSWEKMRNKSLRCIQRLSVTPKSTVLLYRIIFPFSSIFFSSTPPPCPTLLCSVFPNLFASMLPCPANLCQFFRNQEIMPPIEDAFPLGPCIEHFSHTKLFENTFPLPFQ